MLFGKRKRDKCSAVGVKRSTNSSLWRIFLANGSQHRVGIGETRGLARGNVSRDAQNRCALTIGGTVLNVINSRGYTQICVGPGDSLQARLRLDSKTQHMLSTKA